MSGEKLLFKLLKESDCLKGVSQTGFGKQHLKLYPKIPSLQNNDR